MKFPWYETTPVSAGDKALLSLRLPSSSLVLQPYSEASLAYPLCETSMKYFFAQLK